MRPFLSPFAGTSERQAKRQRSDADKAAKAAKRAAAASVPVLEGAAWRLKAAQPWADKEAKAPELNEEQTAYLERIAAEKAAKEAEANKAGPVCFLPLSHL